MVGALGARIEKPNPKFFVGSGKAEELREQRQALDADLILVNHALSPVQERNLEKYTECRVVDRTGLILDIFAQRARSHEGKLQVELAQLKHMSTRLVRGWTHLERQRGGAIGLRGPGETQLELDRRLLAGRVKQLEQRLEKVETQRTTARRARQRNGLPVAALVGYTNAGKSTLLRALTDADVLVEDKLFATLDPTTRKFILPNKQAILLIDTVGFIRKIPHQLVAAFRSTLEEAVQADILLHLVDMSNPHPEATYEVLKELNATKHPILTVLNKIDVCQDKGLIYRMKVKYPKTVAISALTGEGFEELMALMIREISLLRKVVKLRVPQSHYALLTEVMREGKILSLEYEENDILVELEIPHHLERKVAHFIY